MIKQFFMFFLYVTIFTGYYQKHKEKLSQKTRESYKIFLKKKKIKSVKMLMSDIELFLKRKRKEASIWL